MKKQSSKYIVLLLLLLTFAAPGITAYIVYQHPDWLSAAKVNKGTLLNPPLLVNELEGENKWRLVFWVPEECDALCLKHLDTLARVRLALGRKLYQVDQWLLLSKQAHALSPAALSVLNTLDFQQIQLVADISNATGLFSEPKIFLADPNKYLVLSYVATTNPEDIYKDLKLLLNATEKNG